MSDFEPCRFLQTSTPKEFLCSVCTYVMKNPAICSKCKVVACKDCSKKCGITCEHSFGSHLAVKAQIEDMPIKCKHWKKGCMEILKLGKVEAHEESNCYFSHSQCGRKECEEISLPGKIRHMAECGFFLVSCETCKKELKQSDKPNHKCIDWLNAIVENLEKKIEILKSENKELLKKNNGLKSVYSVKGPELDQKISEYQERKARLAKDIEQFKVNTQKDIQELQDKGVDKMKVFHENAETRVKSLWNKSQYDYEHLAKRMNDNLRTCLDGFQDLLNEFAIKAETEDLVADQEKGQDNNEKSKINGNGVSSNALTPQKTTKPPNSASKVNNNKVAVSQKK